MPVKVVLVDVNAKMVDAWKYSFENHPEVEIVHGSMLTQIVSAWVTSTNARGQMDSAGQVAELLLRAVLDVLGDQRLQGDPEPGLAVVHVAQHAGVGVFVGRLENAAVMVPGLGAPGPAVLAAPSMAAAGVRGVAEFAGRVGGAAALQRFWASLPD